MRNRKQRAYKKRRILLEVVVIVAAALLVMYLYTNRTKEVFSDAFDLRQIDSYSYVTPVKDQKVAFQWWNNVGADWAFASLASFESSLLKQGINFQPTATQSNFSAWHLATHNGYNQPRYTFDSEINPESNPSVPLGYNASAQEEGWSGNLLYAIDYFTRVPGAVSENDAPWPVKAMTAKETLTPPSDALATMPVMLRKGLIYTADDYHSLSFYRSTIKKALTNQGAIATYMYMGQGDWPGQHGDTFWRGDKYWDFYCDRASFIGQGNHAVTLIGWDDSREISGAPGKGAWLVKDSYGTDWHDGGIFWISYFDRVFLSEKSVAVQLIGESSENYGWPRYETHSGALSRMENAEGKEVWGYLSDGFNLQKRNSWGLARFSAKSDGQLKAVGLMTVNRNETVTINVYGQWNSETNSPADLLHSQTLEISETGYHLLDLETPVALWRDQEFIVAVGFDYREKAKKEPLVVVIDPAAKIETLRTFRNSWRADTGFAEWEDLATADIDDGKIFYIQAVTEAGASGATRF